MDEARNKRQEIEDKLNDAFWKSLTTATGSAVRKEHVDEQLKVLEPKIIKQKKL